MTTIGVDIGFTTGGVIVWSVFADTNRYAGMLTGKYGGATAEVSVAAGLGANVLVAGSNRTVSLQPLSLQGQGRPRHCRWHRRHGIASRAIGSQDGGRFATVYPRAQRRGAGTLALQHLTEAKRIISQFGPTPMLAD